MNKEYSIKTVTDTAGNELVLLNPQMGDRISNDIIDRVAFESFYNHCHILDKIQKKDILATIETAKTNGKCFYQTLKRKFPKKHFLIFATISDSLIIRFHQKWTNELPYCNVCDFHNSDEIVIMFDTDKNVDDYTISRF